MDDKLDGIEKANRALEKFGLAFYYNTRGSCNTCGLNDQCISHRGHNCSSIMMEYVTDVNYMWFKKLRSNPDIKGFVEEALTIKRMKTLHG